jgi:hypothetical protein
LPGSETLHPASSSMKMTPSKVVFFITCSYFLNR